MFQHWEELWEQEWIDREGLKLEDVFDEEAVLGGDLPRVSGR
jgi:hypothetical protein